MAKWLGKYKSVVGILVLAIMALGLPATLGLVWVQNVGLLSADAVVFASDAPAMDRFMAAAMKGVYGDRIQVCDGTADQVEINAAVNAGYNTRLSQGTFTDNAPIIISDSYKTLEGQGWGSVIEAATDLNSAIICTDKTSTARYGITIRDLTVDGNEANQSTSGVGIDLTSMQQSLIEHVKVYDCKTDGIYADGTTPTYALCTLNNIERCIISAGGGDGVHLKACYGVNVVDCPYIGNNGGSGVNLESGGELTVTGCCIDQNTSRGIYAYACKRFSIMDNYYIGDNGRDGIEIDSAATDILISGNLIMENGSSGMAPYGIYLLGTTARCSIVGNRIWDNSSGDQDYAIRLGASTVDTVIRNNDLGENVVSPILVNAGATYTIAGNRKYLAPAETRTYAVRITAGTENATTYWQNPFAQNVWVTDAKVVITTAASATDPTYDLKIDADGSGVPDGTALIDAAPDTVGTYLSWNDPAGAWDVQTAYVQLGSNAGANDWLGLCIEDAAGADVAGTVYVTIMGQ